LPVRDKRALAGGVLKKRKKKQFEREECRLSRDEEGGQEEMQAVSGVFD